MPKMIQIRHVPDETHRLLKSRAASAGLTLSDYVLRTVVQVAAAPTDEELLARFAALEPIGSDVSSVELVRAGRDERDAELAAVERARG